MRNFNTKKMMLYRDEMNYETDSMHRYNDDNVFRAGCEDRAKEWMSALDGELAKLNELIKEAEGRASVRRIDAVDVLNALDRINVRLAGVPKKAVEGTIVNVDFHAREFPAAYKYAPESTHFLAVYRSGSWVVTDIYRSRTRRPGKRFMVTLSQTAKEALLETFTGFHW